jgi:hypothetical protein
MAGEGNEGGGGGGGEFPIFTLNSESEYREEDFCDAPCQHQSIHPK